MTSRRMHSQKRRFIGVTGDHGSGCGQAVFARTACGAGGAGGVPQAAHAPRRAYQQALDAGAYNLEGQHGAPRLGDGGPRTAQSHTLSAQILVARCAANDQRCNARAAHRCGAPSSTPSSRSRATPTRSSPCPSGGARTCRSTSRWPTASSCGAARSCAPRCSAGGRWCRAASRRRTARASTSRRSST